MKYVTLMLLACFSYACLQAQTVLVRDSSVQNDFGSVTSTINTYTYDAGCKPSVTYTDGTYGDTRYRYNYNADGSLHQVTIDQLSKDGVIYGGSRKTYRYLANGKVESVYSERRWDSSTYRKDSLILYQYNPQNLPVRKLVQLWNTGNSQYEKNRLDSTVYTSGGQLSRLFVYMWPGGKKELAYKTLKFYNSDGTIDSIADYDYIDFEGRAIGAMKYHYTYFDTLKKRYARIANYWVSYVPGGWALANTEHTIHDSANLVSYDTSTNDNYGNITYYITHRYNTDNTLQSVYTQKDYYGDGYTDQTIYTEYTYAGCSPGTITAKASQTHITAGRAVSKVTLVISPNPVRSVMHVSLPVPSKTNSALRMYDAGGRLVMQQTVAAGASSLNIDCSRVGRGIYIVTYEGAAFKVIKE